MGGRLNKTCYVVVLWCCLILSCTQAVKDTVNGCKVKPPQIDPNAPLKPTIPNMYEVHVECIIMNKNQSTEVDEYFDYDGNRAAIRQRQQGIDFYAYYDYASREFIGVFPGTMDCSVLDLSKTNERALFGYTQTSTGGHIFTASSALRFGTPDVQEIYVGKEIIRGIQTRKWYSCQYWKLMDATMDVTWYFSDPDTWDTSIGLPEIPVRAHVKGVVYDKDSTTPRPIEHIYDFVHYKNVVTKANVFETPSMIVCPNRKNTKPFPQLPTAFSFTIEMIDTVRQAVTFMTESYDMKSKVTKFQYKPTELSSSKFGYNPLTEIHDFNTGVAYVIDNMIGNCTALPIEQGNFDDKKVDARTVRMRTSTEFFSTENTVVTYEGKKGCREMNCDTWVGMRDSTPSGIKENSTWEWYFQTDDWTSVQQSDETSGDGGTPVMMKLSVPELGIQLDYNLYGFSKAEQDLMTYDISSCYANGKRRRFDFQVTNSYRNAIDNDRKVFIYSTMMSLSGYMDVSPLRIANLQLRVHDDIHVTFDLLDVAPAIGDIQNMKKETALNDASNVLIQAINNNEFVVILFGRTQVTPITIVPGSIIEYSYDTQFSNIKSSTDGYTGGSMAGLAVGMILAGGVCGAALGFKLFK